MSWPRWGGDAGMGCPRHTGRVSGCSQAGSSSCQTPVSEGALRSGFILFLFLLFLTFAEAQRKATKMPHSLFPFLYLLARSIHLSFGYLQPVPCKCHIWVSPCRGAPICTEPPVLGLFTVAHLLPASTSLPRAVGRQGAVCTAGGYLGSWSHGRRPRFWDRVYRRRSQPSLASVSCIFGKH